MLHKLKNIPVYVLKEMSLRSLGGLSLSVIQTVMN